MERNLKERVTNYTNVKHETINFIDDSSSIIEFEDPSEANFYLDRFFKVLKVYYNDMKLKLNSDKTSLLVISRPNHTAWKDDIILIDDKETIKPERQIKVLGWLQNERMSQDSTLSLNIGVINTMLIARFMNTKTRTMVLNSFLLPHQMYGIPQLLGEKQTLKNRTHAMIMKLSRWNMGSYRFKLSCKKICAASKWNIPTQMIIKSSATNIHQIVSTRRPEKVIDLIKMPRTRTKAKMTTKHRPRTKIYPRTTISAGIDLYNQLPDELKSLDDKEFKRRIKKMTLSYLPS